MFRHGLGHTFLALVLLINVVRPVLAQTDTKPDSQNAALLEHLRKAYPGKTWDVGPLLVDTPEVRQAYGGRQFYIVLSHEPRFPRSGIRRAADDPVLKKYGVEITRFRENKLSLTLGVDAAGAITEYREAKDFAQGLIKITDEETCQTAVAAVLTLYIRDEFGYVPVKAKHVQLNPPGLAVGTQAQVEQGEIVQAVNIGPQGNLQSLVRSARVLPP